MKKAKKTIKFLLFIFYTLFIIFLCYLVLQNKYKENTTITNNVFLKTNIYTKIITNKILIIQSNEGGLQNTNFLEVVLTNLLVEVMKEKLQINKYMVGLSVSYPVGIVGMVGFNVYGNYYILLNGGVIYTNYCFSIGIGYGF